MVDLICVYAYMDRTPPPQNRRLTDTAGIFEYTHTTHIYKPQTTAGVPYGDCFHVQTRWVLTRVGTTGKRCRLQIGLEVVFRQTVFLKCVSGVWRRCVYVWLCGFIHG